MMGLGGLVLVKEFWLYPKYCGKLIKLHLVYILKTVWLKWRTDGQVGKVDGLCGTQRNGGSSESEKYLAQTHCPPPTPLGSAHIPRLVDWAELG